MAQAQGGADEYLEEAILVGETLMRATDVDATVRELTDLTAPADQPDEA